MLQRKKVNSIIICKFFILFFLDFSLNLYNKLFDIFWKQFLNKIFVICSK